MAFTPYQQGSYQPQGGGDFQKKKTSFKKSFHKLGKKFNKWGGADKQEGGFKKPFHKPAWNPGQENTGAPQGGFNQRASY